MSDFIHPLASPEYGRIERPDGRRALAPVAQPRLAKVTAISSVTGGQSVTFLEQRHTSPTNATLKNADNPRRGTAIVPSTIGTVAVNDIVELVDIPGMEDPVAMPFVPAAATGAVPIIKSPLLAGTSSGVSVNTNANIIVQNAKYLFLSMAQIQGNPATDGVNFGLVFWNIADGTTPPPTAIAYDWRAESVAGDSPSGTNTIHHQVVFDLSLIAVTKPCYANLGYVPFFTATFVNATIVAIPVSY